MIKLVTSHSPETEPRPPGELRDAERLFRLWHHKAFKFGAPPPAIEFDFSRMAGDGDWGYRFVVCPDLVGDQHAFLIYGSQFARLLNLPKEPIPSVPIAQQLPERYLRLFVDGCNKIVAQSTPVRASGAVVSAGQIELYRAAFLPLAGHSTSSTPLVFGSFNRRLGPKVRDGNTVHNTYNWLGDDSRPKQHRIQDRTTVGQN